MPRRSERSRSLRKIKVNTPGGRRKIHLERKKNAPAKCAICKKPLAGRKKGRDSDIAKLSKTQKRPERPFGGFLCPSCMRTEIKKRLLKSFQ
jgi:large subunit ribosomal protein L34e